MNQSWHREEARIAKTSYGTWTSVFRVIGVIRGCPSSIVPRDTRGDYEMNKKHTIPPKFAQSTPLVCGVVTQFCLADFRVRRWR